MKILQERARTTVICDGVEARDAEVMIQGVSGRRMVTLYVHVNDFQERHYTLAEKSMFDFLTGQSEEAAEVEFLEEYESLTAAQMSEYYPFFEIADQRIDELKKWEY